VNGVVVISCVHIVYV